MVCVYIFDFKVGIPSNITSTRKTLYKHIENAKNNVQDLIDHANKVSAPEGFQKHKELFIKDLNQRMVVLSNYVKVSNTFPYQIQDWFTGMDVLYQLKDAEAKELVQDLENAGFNPKQLKDGSVKYK